MTATVIRTPNTPEKARAIVKRGVKLLEGLHKLATDAKLVNVPNLRAQSDFWPGRKRVAEFYYGFNFRTNKHGELLSQEWRRVITHRQQKGAK